MREEVGNWFKQAQADLGAANDSGKSGHYEWACFQSQQAAEKALKALYIHRERTAIVTHNMVTLAQVLRAPADIVEAARELNADYVAARYPDAANGVPAELYSRGIAERHLRSARKVLQWAKRFLK